MLKIEELLFFFKLVVSSSDFQNTLFEVTMFLKIRETNVLFKGWDKCLMSMSKLIIDIL